MKQCIKCLQEKNEYDYSKRPEGTLYNTCKACKNKYSRELHYIKSKSLEWRLKRSEVNKRRYHQKIKVSPKNQELESQNGIILEA
jgi:hypothetical protein